MKITYESFVATLIGQAIDNEDLILKTRFANDEYDNARKNDGVGVKVGIEYDTPTDGLFQVYWPKTPKQIRYEWYYKDGKRADGKSYGWNEDGTPKQTLTWKNNIVIKTTWYYYRTKQKWYEETYNENGELISKKEWDDNGKLM